MFRSEHSFFCFPDFILTSLNTCANIHSCTVCAIIPEKYNLTWHTVITISKFVLWGVNVGMNRDAELAKLFLECRLAAHLSQYQLADLMGVKQMSIHRWEHGICTPYKKNLNRLFSIYNEILKKEADDLSLLDKAQESEPQFNTPESTNHVSQAVINKLRVIRKQLDHTDGNCNKEK